ncbi:hypothetical protein EYF80_044995 [Liparis tanakae]|uniref:Uncharacterized protein n=1 Tax=Liparis tanakae TaxID=230148 RepID=A0A4Z2FVA5_9TELE|nr:hypothetical protein EYF80_044995 [Liparis tanakae]
MKPFPVTVHFSFFPRKPFVVLGGLLGRDGVAPQVIKERVSLVLQRFEEVLNPFFPTGAVVQQGLLSSLGVGGLPVPMMQQVLRDAGAVRLQLLRGLVLSMEVSGFLKYNDDGDVHRNPDADSQHEKQNLRNKSPTDRRETSTTRPPKIISAPGRDRTSPQRNTGSPERDGIALQLSRYRLQGGQPPGQLAVR